MSKTLAQELDDELWGVEKPGLTARGEQMPQTVDEWRYLADLYAKKIEADRVTISKLKQKINKLEQANERERLTKMGAH